MEKHDKHVVREAAIRICVFALSRKERLPLLKETRFRLLAS